MPLFIEMVLLIKTNITVYLIVFFTIDIFKDMRIKLTFLCSKSWKSHINFEFLITYVVVCNLYDLNYFIC